MGYHRLNNVPCHPWCSGRKRELGSPPIAIKTATDEFLVLQLNALRIVGGVLWCFVHQPRQCSNEPAKCNEETAAHYVLVCCIIITKRNGIFNGSSPLSDSDPPSRRIQDLVQNIVTSIFNAIFQHHQLEGIDRVVKVAFPSPNINRVGPFRESLRPWVHLADHSH